MAPTGGGKATSSGISFQDRIGAWLMLAMWLRIDLSEFLGLAASETAIEVRFETRDPIDDLQARCESGRRILVQAKRSLSLETAIGSEFEKVIEQFVNEVAESGTESLSCVLAVSPTASKRISTDLRRFFMAVREHSEKFHEVPFNATEQRTIERFRDVFVRVYSAKHGAQPTETEFVRHVTQFHVECLDVEPGGSLAKAALMLLTSKVTIPAHLLWALLVDKALSFSSTRGVVSRAAIESELERFAATSDSPQIALSGVAATEWVRADGESLLCGKEVLLVKDLVGVEGLSIVEMARFEPDGSRRMEFYDSSVLVPAWEEPVEVLCRASTVHGVTRFVKENAEALGAAELFVMIPERDEDPNVSAPALAHSALCEKTLSNKENALRCVHCSTTVSSLNAVLLEVDARGAAHDVGVCHPACVRPVDRIFGLVQMKGGLSVPALEGFDFAEWARLVVQGQFGLSAALETMRKRGEPLPVLWNPEAGLDFGLPHCIRLVLEDGSRRHVTLRNRIHRLSKPDAEERVAWLLNEVGNAKKDGDAWCYTSDTFTFGRRSMLLSMCGLDEECLEVEDAEVVQYSAAYEAQYEPDRSWYSPVCFVADPTSGLLVTLAQSLPLISDPLSIDKFLDNWRSAGVGIEDAVLRLIPDDRTFDLSMTGWERDGMQVIVDPILDREGNLKRGLVINSLEFFQHTGALGGRPQEPGTPGDGT